MARRAHDSTFGRKQHPVTVLARLVVVNVALILGLTALLYVISSNIVLSRFKEAEALAAEQNLQRAEDVLRMEIRNMEATTTDWSMWDDAYEYMKRPDPKFAESNLTENALSTLSVNAICYLDPDNRPAISYSVAAGGRPGYATPPSLTALIGGHPDIFRTSVQGDKRGGFVVFPEGVAILCVHPILASSGAGPARGTLVMTRLMTAPRVRTLSDVIHLGFTLRNETRHQTPLSPTPRVESQPIDDKTLQVTRHIPDLLGTQSIAIRMILPRDIFGHGREAVRYFAFWLWGVSGVFCLTTSLLLVRIHQIRERRRDVMVRLVAIMESTDDAVVGLDLEGRVTSWNVGAARIFGYTAEEAGNTPIDSFFEDEGFRKVMEASPGSHVGEGISHREVKGRKKGGQLLDLSLTVSPIVDSGGKVTGSSVIARDISDRKMSEAELAKQKHLLDEIFDNVHEGIGIVDAEERVVFCNPAMARIFGEEVSTFKGKNLVSYFDTEQWQLILNQTEQRRQNRFSTYELSLFLKNGVTRWISCTVYPRLNPAGEYDGAFGVVTDVTDRKEAEEAIRRWADIFQSTKTGVAAGLGDGCRFDLMNPAFASMHGYSVDDLKGVPVLTVIPRDSHGTHMANVEEAERSGHHVFESEHVRKDGTLFPVLHDMTAVRGKNGELLYRIMNVQDLTDTRRREEEIRKLSRAVEQSPVSVLILDTQGRIEYANPRFTQTSGYSTEEVVGKDFQMTKAGPSPPDDLGRMWETLLDGGEWRDECLSRKKNGSEYWESVTVTNIADTRGNTTHFLVVREDITARKASEEALRRVHEQLERRVEERTAELAQLNDFLWKEIQVRRETEDELVKSKEAAEAANQAKSQFLANISHEIRTPLNAVVGYAELIQSAPSADRVHTYAGLVLSESESLLDLIDELLDMSKAEAGKMELEHHPFDLMTLLNGVKAMLEPRVKQKNLDLRLVIVLGTPTRLFGDPKRLRQVLANLAGNAVKFTERGFVEVRVAMAGETGGNVVLEFHVEDSGIGIPADKLHAIFDPFVQADQSTTRKYGGTGLGTTISKTLVEMMGGEIGVESVVGQGSTFRFTARLSRRYPEDGEKQSADVGPTPPPRDGGHGLAGHSGPPSGAPAEPDASRPRRRRILLVEDYPPNRDIAMAHLEGAGYDVAWAGNGKEAVREAAALAPDMVLMDVQMPEMDGLEATRAIRQGRGPAARVPIIAMTANAFPSDIQACREAGMDDVITKPIRKKLLLETMENWFRKGVSTFAGPGSGCGEEGAPSHVGGGVGFDYRAALEEFEGCKDVLDRALAGFASQMEAQLPLMDASAAGGDGESIRREAHKIKGAAGNLAAEALASAARDLESAAKRGDTGACVQLLEKVRAEFAAMKQSLERKGDR